MRAVASKHSASPTPCGRCGRDLQVSIEDVFILESRQEIPSLLEAIQQVRCPECDYEGLIIGVRLIIFEEERLQFVVCRPMMPHEADYQASIMRSELGETSYSEFDRSRCFFVDTVEDLKALANVDAAELLPLYVRSENDVLERRGLRPPARALRIKDQVASLLPQRALTLPPIERSEELFEFLRLLASGPDPAAAALREFLEFLNVTEGPIAANFSEPASREELAEVDKLVRPADSTPYDSTESDRAVFDRAVETVYQYPPAAYELVTDYLLLHQAVRQPVLAAHLGPIAAWALINREAWPDRATAYRIARQSLALPNRSAETSWPIRYTLLARALALGVVGEVEASDGSVAASRNALSAAAELFKAVGWEEVHQRCLRRLNQLSDSSVYNVEAGVPYMGFPPDRTNPRVQALIALLVSATQEINDALVVAGLIDAQSHEIEGDSGDDRSDRLRSASFSWALVNHDDGYIPVSPSPSRTTLWQLAQTIGDTEKVPITVYYLVGQDGDDFDIAGVDYLNNPVLSELRKLEQREQVSEAGPEYLWARANVHLLTRDIIGVLDTAEQLIVGDMKRLTLRRRTAALTSANIAAGIAFPKVLFPLIRDRFARVVTAAERDIYALIDTNDEEESVLFKARLLRELALAQERVGKFDASRDTLRASIGYASRLARSPSWSWEDRRAAQEVVSEASMRMVRVDRRCPDRQLGPLAEIALLDSARSSRHSKVPVVDTVNQLSFIISPSDTSSIPPTTSPLTQKADIEKLCNDGSTLVQFSMIQWLGGIGASDGYWLESIVSWDGDSPRVDQRLLDLDAVYELARKVEVHLVRAAIDGGTSAVRRLKEGVEAASRVLAIPSPNATGNRLIISPEVYLWDMPLAAIAARSADIAWESIAICPRLGTASTADQLVLKDFRSVGFLLDPSGEFPTAAERVGDAARRLEGVAVQIIEGEQITIGAVYDALESMDLLVIFSHAELSERGASIVLADGAALHEDALDQIGPGTLSSRVVLLINCWSSAVDAVGDFSARELAGLPAALLRCGIQCVIGTQSPVDAGSAADWLQAFLNGLSQGMGVGPAAGQWTFPAEVSTSNDFLTSVSIAVWK